MTAPPRVDTAAAIKSALTMRQVAEMYGFHPNAAGFIQCPFHANGGERTGSCKVYDESGGFYCHACHTGGTVIDFTMRLFEIPFREALKKLNADFNLGLSLDRPSRAELSRLMEQRRKEARRREEKDALDAALFDWECILSMEYAACKDCISDWTKAGKPVSELKGGVPVYPKLYVDYIQARDRLEALKAELDCILHAEEVLKETSDLPESWTRERDELLRRGRAIKEQFRRIEMENKDKICPLMGGTPCAKEKCAMWCEPHKLDMSEYYIRGIAAPESCAFAAVAGALRKLVGVEAVKGLREGRGDE